MHFSNDKTNQGSYLEDLKQLHDHFAKSPLLIEFINAIPNPVLVLNSQRRVIFSNRALTGIIDTDDVQNLAGLLPGEIFKCKHALEASDICGTTEYCTACGALEAVKSSADKVADVQECRIITADNEGLDLKVYTSPIAIENNIYTIFVITDISHEKRRKNLERIFFHDLLNTASSLKALAQSFDDADEKETNSLHKQLIKMSEKLVEEICAQRDIAAAENNELDIHLSRTNTFVMMNELVEQFHPYSKDRVITIDSDSENRDFFTDKVLLRRILTNMMKNALEAAPGEGQIRIGCRIKGENVRFRVHNPEYIKKSVQLQIFQRSFTTKGPDRGLGTYSMKLLCENYLKGKISFSSSMETGTTFFCSVPMNLD